MDWSSCVSPIDYRYVPNDEELNRKVREYGNLDILVKLNRVVPELVIPRVHSLKSEVSGISRENNDKKIPKRVDGMQVGRTTIGKVFAGYADRLSDRIEYVERLPLGFDKLEEAERNDRISDLAYFSTATLSVEANIGNDIRQLFRSEIGEFSHKEFWETPRVGSSTMVHKENPAEYEQAVSLWKAYAPRLISAVLSQITEHQGDSTNEDFPYFTFELECGLSYATKSLENALKNLKINV
jgi:adenylosuccinate lyase